MPDPLVLITLSTERAEIKPYMEAVTARLSDARSDLLHVAAVMAMFDPQAVPDRPAKAYNGVMCAMRRSDLFNRCKAVLEASSDPLTTRELAAHAIAAEGWDTQDRSLRITVAHRATTHLGRLSRRGVVAKAGELGGVTLWRLP